MVVACDGIITQQLIDQFNNEVSSYWDGIRDFLFLHYDTPRNDTEFWRAASSATAPSTYKELKRTFTHRPPRQMDLEQYRGGPFRMFGVPNWMSVAAPLGIVPREATSMDLRFLSDEKRQRLGAFLAKVESRMKAENAASV